MFAPIFGAMADKIGGNKVTIIAFIFFALGIYLLYSGPNTGIFFQINLGLLDRNWTWWDSDKCSNR